MTSIPASRSARAMTFAPRSWPSRPGFATITRIFLDNRRLHVFTPHLAKRIAHFAERCVGAYGLENGLHQVVGSRCGSLQRIERTLDARVVARPFERLELPQLSRRGGLVDVQDLDRRVILLLV